MKQESTKDMKSSAKDKKISQNFSLLSRFRSQKSGSRNRGINKDTGVF